MTKSKAMIGLCAVLVVLMALFVYLPYHKTSTAATITPVSVYGAWHCSNDACIWGTVRSVSEFDSKNHWLVDRGDGTPSVNLVIFSFVQPFKLLNKTTDAQTSQGVPIGMTADIVNYFKSHQIRVMLSIGGITYVNAWNQARLTQLVNHCLNQVRHCARGF